MNNYRKWLGVFLTFRDVIWELQNTRLFYKFQNMRLKMRGATLLESRIQSGLVIRGIYNFSCGNSFVGFGSHFYCYNAPIKIGNNCLIANNVTVYTENHRFKAGININEQGSLARPVVIGDDVWIGSHSIILPGVNIASGSVIGAGAVLRCSTEPNSIWYGNPAVKMGVRR